jgi:rubrerythrin
MKQLSLALFILGLAVSTAIAADAPFKAGTTLENLQAAYNGESNAHARYLAFAQQADKEGYGKAASLFRAAAKAEEIHARNHAQVIKKLGGVPEANIAPPAVKSTKENLEAAIQGETYERDVMYPAFLKVARADRNKDAIQTFNYAKTAEAEHAKLYAEALANLPQMKGAGQQYYVCTVCGYTTAKMDFSKCPSCFSPKHKYEKVS